ncbi:MAG: hypothetical protein QXS42_02810 [Zestosphaera sp.]
MECRASSPEALHPKGIKEVFTCIHEPKEVVFLGDLHKHVALVKEVLSDHLGLKDLSAVFSENEAIGSDYVLYTYRLFSSGGYVGSCRFVVLGSKLIKSLCTISR